MFAFVAKDYQSVKPTIQMVVCFFRVLCSDHFYPFSLGRKAHILLSYIWKTFVCEFFFFWVNSQKFFNLMMLLDSVFLRSPRAICENSTKHMWWLVVTVSVLSGFSSLMLLGVCWWFLCHLQSFCNALSSGVNHNVTARMAAFPISVPCRQPDLGVQYHPWSKVSIRGTASTTPFNG